MRQEAIVAGADDFINYPLNRLELVTRIHSLLRIKEYHADLEQTQNVICALALALEAKDRYTRGHSQRVGDLARTFALHLGLDAAARGAHPHRRPAARHRQDRRARSGCSTSRARSRATSSCASSIIPVIGEEMVRPLTTLDRRCCS